MIPEDIEILYIGNEDNLEEMILAALLETGKFKSKSEIRRLAKQGGVKWNGDRVVEIKDINLNAGGNILRIGKKHIFKIEAP